MTDAFIGKENSDWDTKKQAVQGWKGQQINRTCSLGTLKTTENLRAQKGMNQILLCYFRETMGLMIP